MSFFRLARHRQIAEPEVMAESSEDSDEGTWHPEREESSEDDEEEEEEEEEVDDEVDITLCQRVLNVVEFSTMFGISLTAQFTCRKLREDEP